MDKAALLDGRTATDFAHWSRANSYALDGAGNIISLNLSGQNLAEFVVGGELRHLKRLDLSRNRLQRLVFDTELPDLEYLDISYNEADLPLIDFNRPFPKLKYLYCHKARLQAVRFGQSMPVLDTLHLSGNQLRELQLPPGFGGLVTLYLQNNKLTELAIDPADFPALEFLNLKGNGINHPPKQLYGEKNNCWQDVHSYLRASLQSGDIINNEAKCIFFGNGRSGKTTLSKTLRGGEFNPDEKSTHGILLDEWTIPAASFPDALNKKIAAEMAGYEGKGKLHKPRNIRLNVWDFGGQEYYHATHRLFLGSNVLYLLVWEQATNAQNEERGEYPWEHWQRNIGHYAEKNLTIRVQNKEDGDANDVNERSLRFKVAKRSERDGDSVSQYERDVRRLKKGIFGQLHRLDNLCTRVPKLYGDIRQRLREEQKPYLHYGEYKQICQELDKTEDQLMQNENNIAALTRFLHETGSIICYRRFGETARKEGREEAANVAKNAPVPPTPEAPGKAEAGRELDGYVFIKPEWVTDTIYHILSEQVRDEWGGSFGKKHVSAVLAENANAIRDAGLWIDLMLKFELIFEKRDLPDEFVAPQYLPKECEDLSPKALRKLKEELPFVLRLHYPKFLPKSVISRFIARYGKFQDDFVWKYGLVLHKDGQKALVVSDYAPPTKTIAIRVANNQHGRQLAAELFQSLLQIDNTGQLQVSLGEGGESVTWQELQAAQSGKSETVRDSCEQFHFLLQHKLQLDEPIKESKMDLDYIRNLVGDGRLEDALSELSAVAPKRFQTQLTQLKSRLSALKREERNGTISYDNANISRNQITSSVLALLDEVEKDIKTMGQAAKLTVPKPPPPDGGKDDDRGWFPDSGKPLLDNSHPLEVKMVPGARTFAPFNTSEKQIKILFLAAGQLLTGKESRFKDLFRYFDSENRFDPMEEHGVKRSEFHNFVSFNNPEIVHYGGHGHVEGIVLEDGELRANTLVRILKNSGKIQCAILNACNSLPIAMELAKHIPYAIGTQSKIDDPAAVAFSKGFYLGIVSGKTVEAAFEDGIIKMEINGFAGQANIPVLVKGVK